jgi:predicted transposase YdaD
LPFYILKLRKAAKRAKTDAEKRKVEEDFKETGLKLKVAIEGGVGGISEEDIATLLERLVRLVDYVGRGYRTVEVKTMLNNSLKGYGQVLLERGERRGERRGKLEGKLETAMNALKIGLSIQQTAQITGIPEDKLLKQLNKPQQ